MTLKPLKEYNSSKFSGKLITPSFYLLSYSMILLNFAKSTHISCVLTSELNSSQSGCNHYYNFSDLREADGAR